MKQEVFLKGWVMVVSLGGAFVLSLIIYLFMVNIIRKRNVRMYNERKEGSLFSFIFFYLLTVLLVSLPFFIVFPVLLVVNKVVEMGYLDILHK